MKNLNTKNIIFSHFPKAACSYINKVLATAQNDSRNTLFKSYTSLRHTKVKKEHKSPDNIIVGNIRHPLLIYVSMFAYNCRLLPNQTEKTEFGIKYYSNVNSIEIFREWLKLKICDVNDKLGDSNLIYQRSDVGVITNRFFHLYNDNDFSYLNKPNENPLVDLFIKAENISDALTELNLPGKHDTLVNSSPHLPWREYYTDELIDLVYEKDKYIFDKFEYTITI